jgi:hypothetical protein
MRTFAVLPTPKTEHSSAAPVHARTVRTIRAPPRTISATARDRSPEQASSRKGGAFLGDKSGA